MKTLTQKINAAVWVVLISNILGGIAFIVAFFLTKEILFLVGGFFVMIAAVGFKLLIQGYIDKLKKYE